jgi:hypothetical protein
MVVNSEDYSPVHIARKLTQRTKRGGDSVELNLLDFDRGPVGRVV